VVLSYQEICSGESGARVGLLAVPRYLLARAEAALALARTLDALVRWTQRTSNNSETMQLPLEIAMEVGSFLNSRDLTVSTTQLCAKGVKFVARPITDRNATLKIRLYVLITCASSSVTRPAAKHKSKQSVAQEAAKRIEFCLARRANVAKIALHQAGVHRENKRVYAELYGHFQHAPAQVQPNQNQAITVEWHISGASITGVAGLVELGSATADAPSNEAAVHPRYRLLLMLSYLNGTPTHVSALASCISLHTLDLSWSKVRNVSAFASCQTLHTLDLSASKVTDVSALSSCPSLHMLNLSSTDVADVSALVSCQALHTLELSETEVHDVSALAASQSLHTLDLGRTKVSDVSALASCQSLHTLELWRTQVRDVSALASCLSLHSLDLDGTLVTDVSALARCPTLHRLSLRRTQVSNVAELAASKSLHTVNLVGSKVRDVSALKSCVSLREVEGADGMAGYGALQQLLLQRQTGNPASSQ
jgi:hypothetical protein